MKGWLFRMSGSALCLAAVLTTLGGHWLVLQSVAWACMIRDYSRQGPLGSALVMTFDGRHPCRLCVTIQDGRQQEQSRSKDSPTAPRDRTTEIFCEARRTVVPFPPALSVRAVPTVPRGHADFIESPPTPPPRAA